MSTRSFIGTIDSVKGTVRYVYCHWDGYPEYVGRVLFKYYQDIFKIETLLQEGDISSLAPEINPTRSHSFGKPQNRVTVFYHRDRGDNFSGAAEGTLDTLKSDCIYSYVDFVYLYDERKKIWVFTPNLNKEFNLISLASYLNKGYLRRPRLKI